jgi:hypothetical protein
MDTILANNPGLNIGQYDQATQYALMQALNFTPWSAKAWLPEFLAGDTSAQITPHSQHGDIGILTMQKLIDIARSRGLQ